METVRAQAIRQSHWKVKEGTEFRRALCSSPCSDLSLDLVAAWGGGAVPAVTGCAGAGGAPAATVDRLCSSRDASGEVLVKYWTIQLVSWLGPLGKCRETA